MACFRPSSLASPKSKSVLGSVRVSCAAQKIEHAYMLTKTRTVMDSLSNHLRHLLSTTRTSWGLDVVRGSCSIDAITPNIRAQFTKGEALIVCNDAQAQSRARLTLADGAVVEVIHLRIHSFSECLALGRPGDEEVGAKVHVYTGVVDVLRLIIYQSGLSKQTFLDVYQKDQSGYASAI